MTPPGNAPQDFDTLHPQLLQGFDQLVTDLGGNPTHLLADNGLQRGPGGKIESKLTYKTFARLLEHSAQALNTPDFGLRLAKLQGVTNSFGVLGELLRYGQTFGDGLDYIVNHNYLHSLAAKIWKDSRSHPKLVFIGHDILVEGVPNKEQVMEFILLLGHLGALEFTAGRARARRVQFRHQPVSSPAVYRRYFGCAVFFGQQVDCISFSKKDLACTVVDPDTTTFAKVVEHLDAKVNQRRPPLHAQLRGIIMHSLTTGSCDLETAARKMNLHPRTLHRGLTQEGTSFQKIKDEVRRDTMVYYLLHTDLTFSAISEKLGFAEQAIMSRSCQRWLSASPSQIRSRRTPTA
ncbi:AraC family transcriptional regulator [Aestuariicella hydrocarbonica]|uniref:AraC family transcriptional regulator n=1 Tax=Pseudomaricurvus hydrocarbonicus TaxID=1470433 RepID=A0A9E5JUN9_9GAMM|nr:AraC family transcriptional regulator [Aestuariicella hydrocarbonica]NHO65644.1 AraC family transcriptional regulator [Aestuariicella hydrocarbonica]